MAFKKTERTDMTADYQGDETMGGEYEPLGAYEEPTDNADGIDVRSLNREMPFTLDQLDKLEDISDLIHLVKETGREVVDARRIFAGGFISCEKEQLVNVPLIIMHWEFFYSKKYGCNGVAVWAMCEREVSVPGGKSKKVIFTDTSTGIYNQLYTRTSTVEHMDFIMCPEGLSAGEYETTDTQGNAISATTYRIPV